MSKARFRGLKKVEIQFFMTAAALNLKKMVKILDAYEIKTRIAGKFTNITQAIKDVLLNLIKEEAIQVP